MTGDAQNFGSPLPEAPGDHTLPQVPAKESSMAPRENLDESPEIPKGRFARSYVVYLPAIGQDSRDPHRYAHRMWGVFESEEEYAEFFSKNSGVSK